VIVGLLISFATALGLIPVLERWAHSRDMLDIPNERSSHTNPTPRVGGIGIVAGLSLGEFIAWMSGNPMLDHIGILAVCALVLTAISFADDLQPLPVPVRLAGQSVIAGVLSWQAASPSVLPFGTTMPALMPVLVAVWIIGLINAYNFMDGIDGIAGGQAVVAGIGWAIVGAAVGVPALVAAALMLVAACGAFLRFNWPPARVFMGDAGSAFLGFVFSVLPLSAALPGPSILVAALFVWPFLFDTTFTLVRRLFRRENVLRPHRSHLYQRLTATGLTHARVTSIYIGLAALGLPAGVCFATGRWIPGLIAAVAVPVAAVALWQAAIRREAVSLHITM
jgi:Fuc2NAc and GlcNAc transferase